ncbi:MAG: nucleotidyltransferase [Paraclostridium sp.]
MKLVGLVVEYNPFHNGHLYHLNKSKEITQATHSIAVMSGNFLQRGEPALFDKYTRAKMAVANGVDLVIELPTLFACQSAEIFSHGAITLLNSLGCVDSVCFGSEEGDINILYEIAKILNDEPLEFKNLLKNYLDEGLLFATSRSKALYDYIKNNSLLDVPEEKLNNILNSSNNILGIEYIKSILRVDSSIKPQTISRIKAEYNSEVIESNICSATAIRKSLKECSSLHNIERVVPNNTFRLISECINSDFHPMFDDYFFDTIKQLTCRDLSLLSSYFDVNEGIENKIYKSVFHSNSLDELQQNIKSKRYTLTKIKRILNNILLGITKNDMNKVKSISYIPYVRILAFNDKGREIIKQIKLNSDITIVNKFSNINTNNDDIFKTLISYDIKASNIYNLIYYKNNANLLKGPMDFYVSPTYIK